jgi:Tol biopolymer transport system component
MRNIHHSEGKPMKLTQLMAMLFSFSVFAQDLVFMREEGTQKQIWLKNQQGVFRQLTEGDQWHLYPTISADSKWMAWVEGLDEKTTSIKITNMITQKTLLFPMNVGTRMLHPHFSKNGQWLVFVKQEPEKNSTVQLYSMKAFENGTLQTQSIEVDGQSYFPKLSADGAFIIFQRNLNGKKEILFHDRYQNKTEVVAEGMSPALSFDEQYIVFTQKNTHWGIRLYHRFTKEISVLTDPADYEDMAPTFSPKNKIVFASNQTGKFQIYELEEGERKHIVESNADDYAPQFSGETRWAQDLRADLMSPARSSFGSLFHLGKIYVSGGHKGSEHTYPPESFCDNFQRFNPETGTWEELAPRPHKAHGYQIAGFGKYIYAFGGFAYSADHLPKWKSLTAIDRYNMETNTWETIGHLPRARSSNVAAVIDQKVYLIGGWDSTPKAPNDLEGTFHSAIDVFDLNTETVSEAFFTLPAPLRRAFSATTFGNKIILVGGLGVGASHFELLSNVTSIDPITGMSAELTHMPFATFAPAAEVLGTDLFVFGGMFKLDEMNYEYVSHIYAYNFNSLEWRHTGRFLTETKGFSQVVPLSETMLGILGGHRYFENTDSPVATFETFGVR